MAQGDVIEALQYMFLFAAYGFFIVIPTLFFIAYISYYLLTKKEHKSKRGYTILKVMFITLIVIVLLYVAAFNTDLLDNII